MQYNRMGRYFGSSALVTSACAAMLGVIPAVASAQTASGPTAQKPSDVQEIIVTATRREESLQKVPLSVTALSEEQLAVSNVEDVKQLGSVVPTLTFKQGGNDTLTTFYLRGIGTYLTGQGVDPSVGVSVDGVAIARASGIFTSGLKDIERVEVLEGPQGTLFGKNTSAGLVSVTTRKPVLGLREFTGSVSFGTFDDRRVDATANVPLNDSSAVRAAFWHRSTGGFVDVVVDGTKLGAQNSWGGRLSYKYQPDGPLTVQLIGEWTGSDSDSFGATMRYFSPTPTTPGRLVQNYERSRGIEPSPTNLKTTSQTRGPHNRTYNQSYTALVDYDLGPMTLSSVTSYKTFHYVSFGGNGATSSPDYVELGSGGDNETEQFSQEVRLTSPGDQRIRYVVGALAYYALIEGTYISKTAITGTAAISAYSVFPITNRSYAAFGEATFDVTDRLHLIAGGRVTKDSNNASLTRTFFGPPPAVLTPGTNTPGAQGGEFQTRVVVKDGSPSWRLGARFDVAEDIMAYGTVSRGYKAGSIDLNFPTTAATIAATGGKTKPEFTQSYEIGLKSRFLDDAVTLNVAAFRQTVKQFQVSLRQQTGSLYSTITANAPLILTKGVETQFSARLHPDLRLAGSIAYVDAKFADFPSAPCYSGQPVVPANSPVVAGGCIGGAFQSMTGLTLANAPKWAGTVALRYNHDLSTDRRVFVNAAYRYRGKANFSSVLLPTAVQPGYGVADLNVGLAASDDRWRLTGYLNNVFDKAFVTSINDQISGSYLVQARSLDSFRQMGAELSFKF